MFHFYLAGLRFGFPRLFFICNTPTEKGLKNVPVTRLLTLLTLLFWGSKSSEVAPTSVKKEEGRRMEERKEEGRKEEGRKEGEKKEGGSKDGSRKKGRRE